MLCESVLPMTWDTEVRKGTQKLDEVKQEESSIFIRVEH